MGLHISGQETAKWWLTQRRLLKHAVRCSDLLLDWRLEENGIAEAYHNLGSLYMDLGKLDEAEKMYLRALQGYEKALGQQAAKTYIPALNTAQNMAALFQRTGRTQEAKLLYKQALLAVNAVFGRTSNRYRSVAKVLDALHSAMEQDT